MAKSNDLLGLNSRTLRYLYPFNPRKKRIFVDNKLLTKKLLKKAHLPTPKIFHVFYHPRDVEEFNWETLPPSFVIKPNAGFGGEGILVIFGKKKYCWVTTSGQEISLEEIKLHILDILDGNYSFSNIPDVAFIEQKVKIHRAFKKYTFRGTPDIRVIVCNKVPIMAMLRLPTRESGGRANLHQGAIGVGIDISTGITTYASWRNQKIRYLPGTKIKLNGIKIPQWDEILHLASEAQIVSSLGYLGVDIVLERDEGPMILELNARPGLSIQNANLTPLWQRLKRVEDLEIKDPDKAVRVAKELFAANIRRDIEEVSGKIVLGYLEPVKVMGKNHLSADLVAKIDTGAGFSSFDEEVAKKIGFGQVVEELKKVKRLVKIPHSGKRTTAQDLAEIKQFLKIQGVVDTGVFHSASGVTRRPMIPVIFFLKKKKIQTKVSLIRRKNLKYRLIVGRRDLENFIVDPKRKAKEIR